MVSWWGHLTTLFGFLLVISASEQKEFQNEYLSDGEGRAYGSPLSRCEFLTLRLGSELTDAFNAPDLNKNWNERIFQDVIVENLGFAPWITQGLNGLTVTGKSAKDLHAKKGWVGKATEESPYSIVNHKWIYMLGDSTTRQVWASYAAPFKGNNFERNAKEWTRHYCNKQEHRKKHAKDGHFDEEGWRGPCGVNEVTCHVSGYGDKGILSFDWKHFPFEDYDDFLWSDEGPWVSGFPGEGLRRPDLLTVQTGLHTCWHAIPEGMYSQHLNATNTAMIEQHINGTWKLMSHIRKALDKKNLVSNSGDSVRNPTTVVVLTSGSSGLGEHGLKTDFCIQKLNRATMDAAHAYGFAVLDRGEIERRLMYKSNSAGHPVIPVEMHLIQPAQNIVATLLMHLYSCLDISTLSRSKDESAPENKYPAVEPVNQIGGGFARPLHTPPS
jgi:hypothetical protein